MILVGVYTTKGAVVITKLLYEPTDTTCSRAAVKFRVSTFPSTNCASLNQPENILGPCELDITNTPTKELCQSNIPFPTGSFPIGTWSLSSAFTNTACIGSPESMFGAILDTCYQDGVKFVKRTCGPQGVSSTDFSDSNCQNAVSSTTTIPLGCENTSFDPPQSSFVTCTAFSSSASSSFTSIPTFGLIVTLLSIFYILV